MGLRKIKTYSSLLRNLFSCHLHLTRATLSEVAASDKLGLFFHCQCILMAAATEALSRADVLIMSVGLSRAEVRREIVSACYANQS